MQIGPQNSVVGNVPTARRAFSLFVKSATTNGPKLSHSEITELNKYSAAHPVNDFFLFFAGVTTALANDIRIISGDVVDSIGDVVDSIRELF